MTLELKSNISKMYRIFWGLNTHLLFQIRAKKYYLAFDFPPV